MNKNIYNNELLKKGFLDFEIDAGIDPECR